MTRTIPDNADGLWRRYFGSLKYHRYDPVQLKSAYQKQVALCGAVTRTGTGSFFPLGKVAHGTICRKCERLLKEEAKPT